MNRYFVDERSGCIAVRDKDNTDPKYLGLHPDTAGVIRYWLGSPINETCPTCGQKRSGGWNNTDADLKAAYALCAQLNTQNTPADPPETAEGE